MAEEQQIRATQAAAAQAQTTANQGVNAAMVAQPSADDAQTSANNARRGRGRRWRANGCRREWS